MVLYKNWPEICKIGYKDKLLMIVLASASPDDKNEITMGLWLGFSQCFSETPVKGPLPLSVIRDRAERNAQFSDGIQGGANFPGSYDAINDIPHLYFEVITKDREPDGETWITWDEVAHLKQGDPFLWQEKAMVVLEVSQHWFYIAPTECVVLDL